MRAAYRLSLKPAKPLLDKGLELLAFLKEDADKLAAEDLHELMRGVGKTSIACGRRKRTYAR